MRVRCIKVKEGNQKLAIKIFDGRYKSSQVTVFIILGLVLVLSAVLFFAIKSGLIYHKGSAGGDQLANLKRYVEGCTSSLSDDAAFLLEMQGGYLNPDNELPFVRIDNKSYVNNNFKVPLWYYKGRSYVPSKSELEGRIASYVSSHLDSCIANFTSFSNYKIKAAPETERKIKVSIKPSTIEVDTEWKLSVRKPSDSKERTISLFHSSEKSSLGKFYDLATSIYNIENNRNFLEDFTIQTIYSDPSLPTEGTEINCLPKSWKMSYIKKEVGADIASNILFIRFKGTADKPVGKPYFDNLFSFNLSESFPDIHVNPIYLKDTLSVDVSPRHGDTVRPILIKQNFIMNTCIKIYHHFYAVHYTVLFMLTSKEEAFYFSIPVIVNRNLPDKTDAFANPSLPTVLNDRSFCGNFTDETVFSVDELTGKLVAYPNTPVKNTKYPLSVVVIDKSKGEPIIGANISYRCVRFKCSMGSTAIPLVHGVAGGGVPQVRAMFPKCLNGLVTAEKEGYLTNSARESVSPKTANEEVIIYLTPLKPLNFTVRIIELGATRKVRPLRENEFVFLTFTFPQKELDEIKYLSNKSSESDTTITLPVDDYSFNVSLMLINKDSYIGGGDYTVNVKQREVEQAKGMEFYAITPDYAATPEKAYTLAQSHENEYPPKFTW